MKKQVTLLAAVLLFLVACTGCGKTDREARTDSSGGNQMDQDRKLQVVSSFYPMYDFAKKIGGDYAEVKNLVPSGMEPHDWEPGAQDLVALERADLFVYNGAGMEHWTEDVLNALDNQDLVVVEAAKDLELLQSEESGQGHGGHSHNHSHSLGQGDSEHSVDPHVWLDPEKAKQEMKAILDGFVQADPEHAEYYRKNYEAYAGQFDGLDENYREVLQQVKNKELITAHEAFGYLCHAYGLEQQGIEGVVSDSEPDASRMEEIIQFAREHEVKTIFFEKLVSPKVAETIADEVGAKTAVLDTLEGLDQEDLEKGEDYFSVMERNLKTLEQALNE